VLKTQSYLSAFSTFKYKKTMNDKKTSKLEKHRCNSDFVGSNSNFL